MIYIYVLRLECGKYYVGRTKDVWLRINEHFSGNGTIWTKMYAPLAIERVEVSYSRFDEDN